MSEFSLDAAGLTGLSRQLARAADDAFDVLDYTKRQCDLDWPAEGLLMKMLGPHDHVYASVTGALGHLQDLTAGASGQVDLALDDYLDTDRATAARLDAAYPQANVLPDAGPIPAHPAFADVATPGEHLTDPGVVGAAPMWSMNPLTDLVSPAAWVRQVSITLFGHDPFDGWARALSGDWASYVHCGAALSRAGDGTYDIGRNLLAGAADAAGVWEGNAADAERDFQVTLGDATVSFRDACATFAGLYGQAADAASSLRDVAGDLITGLLDALIMVNLASAVGTALIETGVGALAGYGVAAYYTAQAYQLYQQIARCYSTAEDLFEAMGAAIGSVRADLDVPDLPTIGPYRYAA
jgi:hypothetical protein